MTVPLLVCGHATNATTSEGKPACAICDCTTVAAKPDLTGRLAFCSYSRGRGGSLPPEHRTGVPSSTDLAFFEYQPDKEHDRYYCGCLGWD